MKKFLFFILTLTYIASSSGATVYLHYCSDKIVEWSFMGNEKEQCPNCGMDKGSKESKDCCTNKYQQLKGVGDQNLVDASFQGLTQPVFALPVSFIEIPAVTLSSLAEENPQSNAPPRSCSIPIYQRNCVYLI